MKETINAYWDAQDAVTVEVSHDYYDGNIDKFQLIDCNNEELACKILKKTALNDHTVYRLKTPLLDVRQTYDLIDERYLKTGLHHRFIVKSPAFNEAFFYEGDDLGVVYSKESCQFKLWAPTATRVILDLGHALYPMHAKDKGVYALTLHGDYNKQAYKYLVYRNGQWAQTIDPNGQASTGNHQASVVVNTRAKSHAYVHLQEKTHAVIYEMHVRDFSLHRDSGIEQKAKFSGLVEKNTRHKGQKTGFDHVLDLGVSHLQLLPIYDFGSVDEHDQLRHYNWGYDPVQYNVPEGSYGENIDDPYSRIDELKAMVETCHDHGLGVIMDVVYNHVFDRFSSSFEQVLPYYYFRFDGEKVSNGSFCGNDFDSTMLMARQYIVNSVKHWMKTYGIDGFRFDLMGILDVETMNTISREVYAINPSALIYGEGWDMPTALGDDEKATMFNQEKLEDIGFFNDVFRDEVKGSSMTEKVSDKGLCLGNLNGIDHLEVLLKGSPVDKDGQKFFLKPWQTINYVACHDNQTAYDKMLACGVEQDQLVARHKLMLALVLCSRGIPFIHSGQEFCRTKGGDHNSYKSSDVVNALDWDRRVAYDDVVAYTKALIALRKDMPVFRSLTFEERLDFTENQGHVQVIYDKGYTMHINFTDQARLLNFEGELIFNRHGRVSLYGDTRLAAYELLIIKTP